MWDCILQMFYFFGTISSKESTHDRVVASRVYDTGLTEYIGREVAPMTAYEIIWEHPKVCVNLQTDVR